jgi:toxin ParE1/3/4
VHALGRGSCSLKSLKLIRSQEALQDLEDIHLTISLDNPDAADRFLEAVMRSLRVLCQYPSLGPRYRSNNPELSGIRFWPVRRFRNYLIFYRPEPEEGLLRVVRVLHGARDVPPELH